MMTKTLKRTVLTGSHSPPPMTALPSIGGVQAEVIRQIQVRPDEANVTALSKRLSTLLDRPVEDGEVSRAIKSLSRRGYVTTLNVPREEGTAMRGRPRVFYKLSSEGEQLLNLLSKASETTQIHSQPGDGILAG